MTRQEIEILLTEGHPNSLGNTVRVVDAVLVHPEWFPELFACYASDDEVVRMRVSNAMKRIARAKKALLVPYIDRFLNEVSRIDQASARWSLAQLFLLLQNDMLPEQRLKATDILIHNLNTQSDWIVLNMTLETLGHWAQKDASITESILPRVQELLKDPRKSVQKKASKTMALLR